MGDLIKGAEAELFGAHEWAVDQLEAFAHAPELLDRLAAADNLLRSHQALEQYEKADEAAALLAQTEGVIPAMELARVREAREARERLLDAEAPAEQVALAQPFLDAFRRAWAGDRTGLAFDAALAALVQANLLATHQQRVPTPGAPRWHVEAARLYEELADLLEARVRRNEPVWQESARAAWNRAVVAWRFAKEDARAQRAGERATAAGANAPDYMGLHERG